MEWIGVSALSWVTLAHVLLFVFWLGADFGVYYSAKYVARADLSKAERLRFLELLMRLDMYPRSSLILMLPVGFTLAHLAGWANVSVPVLAAIWATGATWFILMWSVHKNPQAIVLKRLDLGVRWAFISGLIALAGISLGAGVWTDQVWLSLKLVLFAGVIGLGLLLRGSVALWIKGFGLLESDPDAGNALVAKGHKEATRFAHTLWLLLVVMAFLGIAKPLI
ncbi:MAG: hypothetical protein AAF221_02200 [Pseudomonadota bacterium]